MNTITCLARVVSRVVANGFYSTTQSAVSAASQTSTGTRDSDSTSNEEVQVPYFISAVAGFSKDFQSNLKKKQQFGDDAWLVSRLKNADVLGVADGVGGWRLYGVDPGEFSRSLLRSVERLLSMGHLQARYPGVLLASAFRELLHSKRPITGSSTACLVILSREDAKVYTANIGDSGFLVVRQGAVVHRSQEQQHYFNTPYQLAVPPPSQTGMVLSDSPESADQSEFAVEDGDVILLATDGVFDNVPQPLLVKEMNKLKGVKDPTSLQEAADAIASMARTLALDPNFFSPFARAARQNGIDAMGGKPDDITVLLATVAFSV